MRGASHAPAFPCARTSGSPTRRRGRRLLALVVPLLCLLLPSAASARTSLDGEFLSSLPPATITSASCDYQDGSTLSFEISGVSGAPYAGTFHETGTVTLGPQNEEIAPGLNQYRSRITGFEATFTIDSPAGTVRGTKSLMPGSDTYDYAVCDPFPSMAQVIASQLTYDATIT